MLQKALTIFFAMIGLYFQSAAQGDLLISPKRIVFEGSNQKAELNLMNIGKDTATYSVSFRQYNMTETGKLEIVGLSDTAQMFSEPYLRVFPRQVTLAPGEPQVIMLQCRRKPDMPAGEYRSHLWFRSEKNYLELGKEDTVLHSNQLSVTIIPIFGITIPVIVRSGAVNAGASLSDLKLESMHDTLQNLQFTINRTGNSSIYGNLIVEYCPEQGVPLEVGRAKSVGVYTNINKRTISIKLKRVPDMFFKKGKLKVRYTSPDDAKYIVYAEKELEIANEQLGMLHQSHK